MNITEQQWNSLMELAGCFIRFHGTTETKDVRLFDLTNRVKMLFYKQNRVVEKGFIQLFQEEALTAKELIDSFCYYEGSLPVDKETFSDLYALFHEGRQSQLFNL